MNASVSPSSPSDPPPNGQTDSREDADQGGPLAGPGQRPADARQSLIDTQVIPQSVVEEARERAEAIRRNARMAVSQQTFARTPVAETLVHCDLNDIRSVGLSVARVEEEGPTAVMAMLKESGVSVSSLNWIAGFTGYSGYRLKDTMSEAAATIRLAAALDARCVTVITGPQDGHILGHIRNTFVESMRELAEYASFWGVDLAVMPMTPRHAAKWTFLTSLRKGIDAVREIDSPAVGLTINTRLVGETDDVPGLRRELQEAAPLTKLVRLPAAAFDERRDAAERPAVSNVAVAAELDAAGYRGYYEMSAWSGHASRTDAYRRTLRAFSGLSLDARPDLSSPATTA